MSTLSEALEQAQRQADETTRRLEANVEELGKSVDRVVAQNDALEAERDEAQRRLSHATDWYAQRFSALRKWVNTEVRPLSSEVATRYFAICANGSPSPHEAADWQGTLHARTLEAKLAEGRATRAEKERDEALGIRKTSTDRRIVELASEVDRQCARAVRAEGLIKQAERTGYNTAVCPWCSHADRPTADPYTWKHSETCPAFTAAGVVR